MSKNQNLFKKVLKRIRNFIFHNEIIYKFFAYLISYLFYFYFFIVKLTSRIHIELPKDCKPLNKSLIFCFWHGRLLSPIFARKIVSTNAYVLLSKGKDAELITVMLNLFKVNTIRGSKSRKYNDKGGVSSLKKMIKLLKQENNTIAIAPDGPIGPRMRVAPGVAMLSLTTKVGIMPLTMSAKFNIIFKTWDSFLLPLPFNKIVVKIGEQILPFTKNNKKKPLEDYRKEIEEILIKLTQDLDKKLKIPLIMPLDVDKKNNPLKRKLN